MVVRISPAEPWVNVQNIVFTARGAHYVYIDEALGAYCRCPCLGEVEDLGRINGLAHTSFTTAHRQFTPCQHPGHYSTLKRTYNVYPIFMPFDSRLNYQGTRVVGSL